MSRVDKIIDLIDVGLQTPMPDPTYGEVSPVNRESCFRCNRPPQEGSDMCAGCRSFMLGDSEDDPASRRATISVRLGADTRNFTSTMDEVEGSITHVTLHTDAPAVHSHSIPEVSGAGYARRSIDWTTAVQRVCGHPRCNEVGHLHFEFRPTPPTT